VESSPCPFTEIVGNEAMQTLTMSQLGANALLTASLRLLEMKLRNPDHVTAWW
jgi:hypothetical protein